MSPIQLTTVSAADTRLVGQALAEFLHAGDLVILEGELGAGKTTLTQGIGAGLEVSQRITSPTFIIARTHPTARESVGNLVHVDAYRLEGGDDIEALDLESALENSVVVVEWGCGKVETLSSHALRLSLDRPETVEAPVTGTIADLPGDTRCLISIVSVCGDWDLSELSARWQQLRDAAGIVADV